MTQTDAPADPHSDQELDKRAAVYQQIGFSTDKIVTQLCRFGFPHALIAQRFPDASPAAFVDAATHSRLRSARSQVEQGASPRQLALADMLQRKVPALRTKLDRHRSKTAAPTATTTAPEAAPVEAISFQYVPLIQCSFPHTDPGEITTFTRRNGWLELTLATNKPEFGLPYGVPARLLTIYCASEAIRTRSPEIFLGRSVHDFLRRLEIPITRGDRGSLRVYANQLMRLIHCSVSVDEHITDARRAGLHIKQALFAEEARLWWAEDGPGDGSSLVLSNTLYESILERSAPLSTNAIKQLRKSPMDLDVYAWLVHRLFTLSKPSTISWAQLSGQFGHSYSETRNFRQFFLASLKRVHAVYPDAHVATSNTGLTLLPSKPHVPRTAVAVPR
jgi:hypothetical protein